MKISEILRDIFTDVDIANQKYKKDLADIYPSSYGTRHSGSSAGFFKLFLPQFIGFIIGLAFTKLIGASGAAYIIFGGVFALAIGVYKSVSFDKIAFIPAVIRNIIIMLLFCLLSGIAVLMME
ncbi:hypothetical protein [Ruminococcus flavefaciens]|uniref:hypothetical protein n=1 Tax=Ruminococcus flavefaciens TaxID=1265 RepID=UPI0002E09DEE|nr:hypothetical protein [Ruminococcus flavefaciens]